MKVNLKKLEEQVVVITGASSGIGLATARTAAKRGAKLVLAARSEGALQQLVDEIVSGGGQATFVVADVGREEDVRRIADEAVKRFGGFDTWINDAAGSIYGKIEEVSIDDARRLFETNFWGVVYGCRAAVAHLKARGAGALINVGSVVSDRAIPMQGYYSASKHAVKGFTDALRMELEEERAAVSVTLIKPTSINTPFPQHAKNYMEEEPSLPPPVYAPEVVAEAILHCAEHPERDVLVGGGAKQMSSMESMSPRLTDKYMGATMFGGQKRGEPRWAGSGRGLWEANEELEAHGEYPGHVMKSSLYTKASLHPVVTGVAAVAGWVGVAAALFAAAGGRERIERRMEE